VQRDVLVPATVEEILSDAVQAWRHEGRLAAERRSKP
jgi:hypothetical protein